MKILEFPSYNIATKFVEITNGLVIWQQYASVDIDFRLESVEYNRTCIDNNY